MQRRIIIQIVRIISTACCSIFLVSCASVEKYPFEKIGYCNYQLQSGNFSEIQITYEEASKERDRNCALWDNQLGSLYLAQDDYDKALDAFLRAHYIMNNIPAFKELEHKATALTGSEDKKAYKGDPYEKAMNSLYVGLLLYNDGDLENAMAAFKNGILADSDSKEETYQSDIAFLYLISARIAKKSGNKSLSDDYLKAVKELSTNPNYSLLGLNDMLINKMLDLKNNVLLVFEFGEGPIKSRRGAYGELAVINGDHYDVKGWRITVDNNEKNIHTTYSNTDIFFQSSTRGGRVMDGILKGKAQFKSNSAKTAVAMMDVSQQLANQANQMRAMNPYADTTGYALASGVAMLFAGCSAVASSITNPKADIRCWSLLPEHIIIFPMYLEQGKHSIDAEFINSHCTSTGNYKEVEKSNYKFDINIQGDKDNIIFKRILKYKIETEKIIQYDKNRGYSENVFKMLISTGKSFNSVESIMGSPHEKRKDPSGREIWIYPSDKPDISNCVFFTNGLASELISQSINLNDQLGKKVIMPAKSPGNTNKPIPTPLQKNKHKKLPSLTAATLMIGGFLLSLLLILLKLLFFKNRK